MTCILFLILLFGYSILNVSSQYEVINDQLKAIGTEAKTNQEAITHIDDTIKDHVLFRYSFIESFGWLQVLLNKYEMDNFSILKDRDGILHHKFYTNGISEEIPEIVNTLKTIQSIAQSSGANFLVVSPPDKYIKGVSKLREGYPYNPVNENIDYFEQLLNENHIFTIKLRPVFEKLGWNLEDIFYKTDHHWTTQASFVVFQQLVEQMEQHYGIVLDKENEFVDETNYCHVLYPNIFLGSQGRRTGVIYSGLDDFIVIYPNFLTNFTFEIPAYDFFGNGPMERVLIEASRINEDATVYEKDYYGMYLKGILYPFGKITNEMRKDGPKVLAIRDSFSNVPLTFFASICKELDLLYPYEFKGNLRTLIEEGDYDYVMVFAYPGNMTNAFYHFDTSMQAAGQE